MGDNRLKNIAGRHYDTFEAYFRIADAKNSGFVEAMDAVKFLRKSGLSDVVLSRIWELSDQRNMGKLDKPDFFTALKLVSLAQLGEQVNLANINNPLDNPPKCGDIPKKIWDTLNTPNVIPAANTDWTISPANRQKYEQIFESLGPVGGLINGNTVRGKLMESKLPILILGRIWDLADQDKDGSLDKHEFVVAWHLVCVALDRKIVPDKLPPALERPKADEFVAVFPDRISPPPVIPPLPSSAARKPSVTALLDFGGSPPPLIPPAPGTGIIPSTEWVVTTMQKLRFDEIFDDSDKDRDGLVSGLEIKDVFLKSGLPQKALADIWGLCDTNSIGKLTKEQFALAMWLVERSKKEGIDPPKVLAPNMVPPSLRPKVPPPGIPMPAAMPLIPDDPPQPAYSNPELQMISEDIQKLAKERRQLELEVAQKEADIKIKSGEVRSLESELSTLSQTLKQLEYQKGEAQKRLDDLKAQKQDYLHNIDIARADLKTLDTEVDKIREQCHKQEEVLRETEGEVDSKRSELQKLKEEEQALQRDFTQSQSEVETLAKTLQDTQLEISQVKAMVTQLVETKRQMSDSLEACKAAIETNDPNSVSEYALNLEPELRDAKILLEGKPKIPPEPEKKPNGFNTRFDVDFSNGFSNDNSSFGNRKGFDDGFGAAFDSKPDPFAPAAAAADPFAPKPGAESSGAAADAFGSDPFAMLHAPTTASAAAALTPSPSGLRQAPSRPESPSPALPPKKAKQPPMRPPPPRPAAGPNLSKSPAPPNDAFGDSFGGSAGASGGFANFADFDNKKIDVADPFASLPHQTNTTTATALNNNTKPADFSEDPFKNYRYEDVFNIEDPFAEGSETIKGAFVQDWVNSNSSYSDVSAPAKATTPVSTPPPPPLKLAYGPTSLNKNKFMTFDKAFDTTQKFNTVKPSKTSISAAFGDPFGDQVNNNQNGSGASAAAAAATGKTTTTFDDDFNDNFANMKFDDNKFGAFGGFDEMDNAKSLTVGGKGRGAVVKQGLKTKFSASPQPNISKQDYSEEDNFGEILAAVLERSKVDQ